MYLSENLGYYSSPPPERSLPRSCFHRCLSIHGGMSASGPGGICHTHPWADTSWQDTHLARHPHEQTLPWTDTPRQTPPQTPHWADTPLGRHSPGQTPPGQTPPTQCMLEYTPPAQCMLGYTAPCPVHAVIRSPNGWYASH